MPRVAHTPLATLGRPIASSGASGLPCMLRQAGFSARHLILIVTAQLPEALELGTILMQP